MAQSGFHCSFTWPPGDRDLRAGAILVLEHDGPARHVALQGRDLQHPPRLGADGQERGNRWRAGRDPASAASPPGWRRNAPAPGAACRRTSPNGTRRWRTGSGSRSRTGPGNRAGGRCVVRAEAAVLAEGGRAPAVRGLPMSSISQSWCGTLGGALRRPSMSSLKQISSVGRRSSVRALKAVRTMVVRSTSWKVPRCGRPEGP